MAVAIRTPDKLLALGGESMLLILSVALPGAVFRWLIIRRPLDKGIAIAACAAVWILLMLFSLVYLDLQNAPTYATAGPVVLYFLLTAPASGYEKRSAKESTNMVNQSTANDGTETQSTGHGIDADKRNAVTTGDAGIFYRYILAVVIGIIIGSIGVYAFTKQSYDDCILQAMPGTSDTNAAALIHRACRNKYPTKK